MKANEIKTSTDALNFLIDRGIENADESKTSIWCFVELAKYVEGLEEVLVQSIIYSLLKEEQPSPALGRSGELEDTRMNLVLLQKKEGIEERAKKRMDISKAINDYYTPEVKESCQKKK